MGETTKTIVAIAAFVIAGYAGVLILDWIALTFKQICEEEAAARIKIKGGGEAQTGGDPVTQTQTQHNKPPRTSDERA